MMATFDLKLAGGTVHTPGGPVQADVGVRDGKIVAIGAGGRSIAPGSISSPG